MLASVPFLLSSLFFSSSLGSRFFPSPLLPASSLSLLYRFPHSLIFSELHFLPSNLLSAFHVPLTILLLFIPPHLLCSPSSFRLLFFPLFLSLPFHSPLLTDSFSSSVVSLSFPSSLLSAFPLLSLSLSSCYLFLLISCSLPLLPVVFSSLFLFPPLSFSSY